MDEQISYNDCVHRGSKGVKAAAKKNAGLPDNKSEADDIA